MFHDVASNPIAEDKIIRPALRSTAGLHFSHFWNECSADSPLTHQRYVTHSMDKKAEMLKTVGWNFVFDGVSLSVDYRKPFDVLADYAACPEWRPQRDTVGTRLLTLDESEIRQVHRLKALAA
jgi:hypothetical protein